MVGKSAACLVAGLSVIAPANAVAQDRPGAEQLSAELAALTRENELMEALLAAREKHDRLRARLAPPAAPAPAAPAVAPAPAAAPAEMAAKAPAAANQPAANAPRTDGKQDFGGIEFGIGLAFTYDLGKRDRIKDARLVGPNNVVRATHVENLRARIILESHYLFTPQGSLFGLRNVRQDENTWARREWGFGPFVAIQPGTDNVIEAVGAGLMLGFRRPSENPNSSDSFNIGVGVMYDLNAQVLGDGIFENQPLPADESEVRFRRQSQSGLLIMTSYSF